MNTYRVTQINVPDFERKVFDVVAEEVLVDGNYIYFIKGDVFDATIHDIYSNVESVKMVSGEDLITGEEEEEDAESEES